jgi:glycerophosphoryl diester phosphodiesterase
MPRHVLPVVLLAAILPACTVNHVNTSSRPVSPKLQPLPTVFDCLRERRLALVVARRGQMNPAAPEHALGSFRNTSERGPILIEVDIARSADGVLMLMHDSTLDRTTSGQGPLSAKTYRQLRELQLKDPKGNLLDERIPTLEEALILAKRRGGVLLLKPRPGTPLADVIAVTRATKMQRQVILVAPAVAEVRAAQKAAPEMMVIGASRGATDYAALLRLANPNLLLFVGARAPDPSVLAQLDAAKVEAAVSTSGAPGERLDDRYLADGDGSEYAALAAGGAALIASDRPLEAWRALKRADRDGAICLWGDTK